MLTLEHTTRSYTGARGCMCGCRGKYSDSDRTRKMAITSLLKNPDFRLQTWKESGGDAGCIYVETPTRNRVLYLTEAGVAAVRAMGVEEV